MNELHYTFPRKNISFLRNENLKYFSLRTQINFEEKYLLKLTKLVILSCSIRIIQKNRISTTHNWN